MSISMFLKDLRKKYLLHRISNLKKKSVKYLSLSKSNREEANNFRTFYSIRKVPSYTGYKSSSGYLEDHIYDDLEKIQSYKDKADSFNNKYKKAKAKIIVLEEKIKNL